jgi:hypothetical protein
VEALRPADPRVLGAFELRSRLADHEAGAVFLGEAASGVRAAVAVLGTAAGADAAVRDRFEAAVARLAGFGRVLASAPRDLAGWAAVGYESDERLQDAIGLLDAAALTSGTGGAVTPGSDEPAFVPHWSGQPNAGWNAPQPPPIAAPSKSSAPAIVIGAVIAFVALLIVGGAVVYAVTGGDPKGKAGPSFPPPPTTSATQSPAEPDVTPSMSPLPSPTNVPKPGAPGPVAGPTYGKDEKKFHMKLRGLPFEFDAPGTWGCMRSDREPFVTRFICVDDGGTFPPSKKDGAGGMIGLQTCAAPCGDGERKALRKAIVVDEGDWKRTDSTTMYAEVRGKDSKGKDAVRVAMSHVFASKPGGQLDTAVAVQLTGPPDTKQTMQKLINEIRIRT